MASFVQLLVSSIFLVIHSAAQRPYFPKAVVLPLSKDGSTLQYLTNLDMGTPLTSINLLVDLGGGLFWVDCGSKHLSSSHNSIASTSLECSFAKDNCCFRPGNDNGTCSLCPENRVTGMVTSGGLSEDIMAVEHLLGPNIGTVRTKHPFLFSCASNLLLNGLAGGVKGVLGLGKTRIALSSQLASAFGFNRKFALCLSSSEGAINIGDGPYLTGSGIDLSKSLMYTPLISNQRVTLEDYYINLKSIKINGERLSLNTTLLSLNQEGEGGTKISTIVPYTTMESTIYQVFTKAYAEVAASMNITVVEAVTPFGLCFRSEGIYSKQTGLGIAVPVIDLVLQSEMVKWRIHARNSMVQLSDEVMCLGFLDGGLSARTSIVIGGYQLEDNLLEFNLATSMLGFSSSLLTRETNCSDIMSYAMSTEPV